MKNSINQPSQRQLRVAEQIRHVLADTLLRGHFHDEALLNANEITVTEVRVSPDLKYATAYVLWLGGKDMSKILPALNGVAAYFQKEVSRQTQLKFTPKLHFKEDDVFDKAMRIDTIIGNIKYSDPKDE